MVLNTGGISYLLPQNIRLSFSDQIILLILRYFGTRIHLGFTGDYGRSFSVFFEIKRLWDKKSPEREHHFA
jgi:hypothetical protein